MTATSRSGSPSSRLAYLYNRSTDHDSPRPRRLSSGIPRSSQGILLKLVITNFLMVNVRTGSRDTSRETSPNRGSGLTTRFRRGSDRPPLSPATRPVLAQKILQQSREAENALADAFVSVCFIITTVFILFIGFRVSRKSVPITEERVKID